MTAPGGLENALHDRYVLERELGRGGTATVYLARDLKHTPRVASKVLHPELAVTRLSARSWRGQTGAGERPVFSLNRGA